MHVPVLLLGGVLSRAWSTPSGGCGFTAGADGDACSEDCPLTSDPRAFMSVRSHKIVWTNVSSHFTITIKYRMKFVF